MGVGWLMDSGATRRFVGREKELAAIRSAMHDGVSRAIVLAGDMGVGKSSLARTALDAAASQGRVPFWVGASASASAIPFGAVLHLIPDIDGGDRYRLLRQTSAWLRDGFPGDRPPVIVVDDAHRLDEPSAALIHHLAVTGSAFIIATIRANEMAPEAVTALWKDGLGERLDIYPLDRIDTVRLLKSLVAGIPDSVSESRLWSLSGGNALYLCELVRGAVEESEISSVNGLWRWTGQLSPSARLNELVMRRLQGQRAEVRRLVDLVAFAEPLSLGTLEIAGCSAELIEFGEEAGLIRSESVNGVTEIRVSHPFYGEVARRLSSSLAQTRMARILLQADSSASRSADGPERIIRRALWQLAGGTVPDPDLLGRGALRALAALDLVMAERLARGSVEAGGGIDSEIVLARVLTLRGKADEAEELLGALMRGDVPGVVLAELAASRAWNLAFGLQRPEDADAVLASAWARAGAGRDILAAQWSNILTYAGLPEAALGMAEQVLNDSGASASATAKAMTSRCESLSIQGRTMEAVHCGRAACRLSSEILHGDWAMSQDEAEGSLAGALIQNGDLAEAEVLIDAAHSRAVEAGWRVGAGMWSVWRGDLSLARGLPVTATKYFRNGLAVAVDERHPYLEWLMRFAWSHLGHAAAQTGDVALAAAALSTADGHAKPWLGALDVWGGSGHAWLAVSRGEVDRGTRLALAAANRARRDQQFGWELQALHQVVRFGRPRHAVDRLNELAMQVTGAIPALYAAHGTALADGDGAALDRVADGFHGYGFMLLAAEAAAQSAHASRHQGNAAASAASLERALMWASICEGARTPALSHLYEPTGLTPRETEISRLVAMGLGNREIADRLVISVRTVENILHHVYEKLAIPGRHELASIFAPPPR